MKRKYPFKHQQSKKEKPAADWRDGSHDSVLQIDILNKLKSLDVQSEATAAEGRAVPQRDEHVTLTIDEISSTGDGLAYDKESATIFVVPYTVPGDEVSAKVARHGSAQGVSYILTDLVNVLRPAQDRDDALIGCKYFAKCSGCQFQAMPYAKQLEHKRRVVEKAYQNFTKIEASLIPAVGATIGSPLQYGYRTKLTPHFDGPPGRRSDRRKGIVNKFTDVPPIGFMPKNSRATIDIEDCPIGTEAVRRGMKRERQRVKDELETFSRGVTLLLREHTTRKPRSNVDVAVEANGNGLIAADEDAVEEAFDKHVDYHTCVTDQKGITTEYVDDFVFSNRAGAFFQNNNSILPTFTQYIRDRAQPPSSIQPSTPVKINYLIDAYCGSGLFSVTLASMFEKTIGIDIDEHSINAARQNAQNNNLSDSKATFIAADAHKLFASVDFPPEQSLAIVDPPRKGCGVDFLKQLLKFGPARVIYVSCNVHTQAKDVDVLVNGIEGESEGLYVLESLNGFDFFPQTSHVESVAVLNRKGVS